MDIPTNINQVMDELDPDEMLMMAVYIGDHENASYLIKNHVKVNYANEKGISPLHAASERGDFQMTKLLLDHGADCNITAKLVDFQFGILIHELTPLINAATMGHDDIAKLLIENGAEVNFKDVNGRSALTVALQFGQKKCAELLIQNGAEVRHIDFAKAPVTCPSINIQELVNKAKKSKKMTRNQSVSVFHTAAQDGDQERLQELIKKGVNLNLKDKHGDVALHIAIENAYLGCAALLIKKGADVNIQNKYKRTPLHIAAHRGLVEIIPNLVENGAVVDAKGENEMTPLHYAVFQSFPICVKQLLNYGANVNAVFADGKTALHVAISKSPECIEFLMKENSDIFVKDGMGMSPLKLAIELGLDMFKKVFPGKYNVSNAEGVTPLHVAAQCSKIECLKLIINDGCDVNVVTDNGDTPLHFACTKKGILGGKVDEDENSIVREKIELLIKAGAKINQKNNMGMAPIHLCAKNDFIEALRVLSEFGAEINSPGGPAKQTPLHYAAEMGCLSCIKYLIEKEADSKIANSENCTALMLAAKNVHLSCMRFLLKNDAPFWVP